MATGLGIGATIARGPALAWALTGGLAAAAALLVWRIVALQSSMADLRRGAAEAAEANEAKSRFLANMSHELRTPLNGIMGFAELLHDGHLGAVSPEQSEGLADILTSSRHLLALVNDILDLSRVASGRLVFHPELFEPRVTVRECVDALRPIADAGRVQLDFDAAHEIGRVRLDPGKLRQVVLNYLSNAIDFTPAGGRVDVRLSITGDRLRVEVSDTGPGISPRDHERVFFEFEQLHCAARRRGGTGLGLAVTKRIVEAQGGFVGVESALGQGSTFFAELPIAEPITVPARPEVRRLPDGPAVRVQEAAA